MKLSICGAALALSLVACGGSSGGSTAPSGTPATTVVNVARIDVTPTPDTLNIGESVSLTATLKDASGNVLTDRTVQWSGTDQHGELSGTPNGNSLTLTAHASTVAKVFASIGNVSGTADLVVR